MSGTNMVNNGRCVENVSQTVLETEFGTFDLFVYQEKETGKEHVVLKKAWGDKVPLVRIHSECATGVIFASVYCDCRGQLLEAMAKIQDAGGLLIYLHEEGRGIGLTKKIKAYELQ